MAEHFPIQIFAAFATMSGNEDTGLRIVAMGERDTRVAGATGGGGNTGHYLELDTLID